MGNPEAQGHELAGRKESAEDAPTGKAFDVLKEQRGTFDVGSFTHARGNLVLDIDLILDAKKLSFFFQVRQITAQIFKHGRS